MMTTLIVTAVIACLPLRASPPFLPALCLPWQTSFAASLPTSLPPPPPTHPSLIHLLEPSFTLPPPSLPPSSLPLRPRHQCVTRPSSLQPLVLYHPDRDGRGRGQERALSRGQMILGTVIYMQDHNYRYEFFIDKVPVCPFQFLNEIQKNRQESCFLCSPTFPALTDLFLTKTG